MKVIKRGRRRATPLCKVCGSDNIPKYNLVKSSYICNKCHRAKYVDYYKQSNARYISSPEVRQHRTLTMRSWRRKRSLMGL